MFNSDDNTTIVKIDMDNIMMDLKKFQERRNRLIKNPPAPLPEGSIKTTDRHKKDNPYSSSKYPVYYIKGITDEDYIEAYINSNPKAKIISFAINRPVNDFIPSQQMIEPIYNIETGKIRIDFREDNFMKDAIIYWLNEE
jgi:hypothetical protein